MLNAIEPGSVLPIHRHQKTSETVVVLRGRLVREFYDELERICTEAIDVSAGGPVCGLNIPAGQWHTVRALENGTVHLVGTNHDLIVSEVPTLLEDAAAYERMSKAVNPYGDGLACSRIVDALR